MTVRETTNKCATSNRYPPSTNRFIASQYTSNRRKCQIGATLGVPERVGKSMIERSKACVRDKRLTDLQMTEHSLRLKAFFGVERANIREVNCSF